MLLLAQSLQAQDDERSQADYEDKPGFGGPESVTEQLKNADELREAKYDWPVFDGYLDWKKQIKEDYDLSFGLHFYGLYQKASDSLAVSCKDSLLTISGSAVRCTTRTPQAAGSTSTRCRKASG
jgi:hypothetical protein